MGQASSNLSTTMEYDGNITVSEVLDDYTEDDNCTVPKEIFFDPECSIVQVPKNACEEKAFSPISASRNFELSNIILHSSTSNELSVIDPYIKGEGGPGSKSHVGLIKKYFSSRIEWFWKNEKIPSTF